MPPRKQRHRRSCWQFNLIRWRLTIQRSDDGRQAARRSSNCPVMRLAVLPFPPCPPRGCSAVRSASPRFPADRKGSAGPSRDCPVRIRSAWDSLPAGAALMRSGRLIGVRSLPPPDHSGLGGSRQGTQATVAAFPFSRPPPHQSSVKRLPVAGSRRVLAPVMPPAILEAGVPPAAPPRPLIAKGFPARPCRHSRQASAPAGLPQLPWCAGSRTPQGAPRVSILSRIFACKCGEYGGE